MTPEERLDALEAQLKGVTEALEALHGMLCGLARLDEQPQDLELERHVADLKEKKK
jgi:hypothetical protein